MAILNINIQSQNQAEREILRVRAEMNRLNQSVAENNRLLVDSDQATRTRARASNRRIRAEQGLLRVQQQRSSLHLANLRQEARELRQATRGTGRFSRAINELGTHLSALGISFLTTELVQFSRQVINASIQIDSYRQALTVLEGSSEAAARTLRDIQNLADEPGLRFREAVDGAVALRAIGVEGETTTRILRELANAAAFTGTGGEFERGLLGFRQLIQRGRLSQEELNQLTENIGLASRVIREEFGTVLAEDIQEQLDASGQSIEDFVETVLTGFERLERFPLDAASVRLKNLSNSFFEFQAAVGDRLLPVISEGAVALTGFFDQLTGWIQDTDQAVTSVDRFAEIINQSNQTLQDTSGIDAQIEALQRYIREQEVFLERDRGPSNAARAAATVGRFFGGGFVPGNLDPFAVENDRNAQRRIELSRSHLAILNQINQARQLERSELQDIERILSASLATARNAGNTQEVAALEQTAQRVLSLYAELDNPRTIARATDAFRNLRLEAAELDSNLSNARRSFTAASNIDDLQRGYQNVVSAIRAAAQATIDQVRDETQAQGRIIAASEAGSEARINAQNMLKALIAERRELEIRAEQDILAVRTRFITRSDALYQRAATLRIEAAQRARAAEVAGYESSARAGRDYANQLRQLATPERRQQFVELVDSFQAQGLSLEDARRRAGGYIDFLNSLPGRITAAEAAYGNWTPTLRANAVAVEDSIAGIRGLSNILRDYAQSLSAAQEAQTLSLLLPERDAAQREQTYFDNLPQGRDLDSLRQEAGAAGREFIEEFNRDTIRATQQAVAEQYSQYERFYRRLSRLAVDSLTGRFDTFQDFLGQLTRELATYLAAYTVSKLKEIAIDRAVTAAKIANQKQLQTEILTTQTASQVGTAAGGLGGLATGLGIAGLGIGLIAALVASGTAERNRNVIGSATPSGQNVRVSLQPSSVFAREQSYVVDELDRSNRR